MDLLISVFLFKWKISVEALRHIMTSQPNSRALARTFGIGDFKLLINTLEKVKKLAVKLVKDLYEAALQQLLQYPLANSWRFNLSDQDQP